MASGRTKTKQEEALQFLDDLDSLGPPPAGSAGTAPSPPAGEEEVYAFIDEITQKSTSVPVPRATSSLSHVDRPPSRTSTPSLRRPTGERVKVGAAPVPLLPTASTSSITSAGSATISRNASPVSRAASTAPRPESKPASPAPAAAAIPAASTSSGWGWGSVWNSASAAIQQAKSVVDEQVKNLPKNEQARKWGEGVLEYAKAAQLDKIGQDFKRVGLSTLTDLLNVVAPPISEHEVIQVWLSHDMQGYEGVETIVYRALSRILEQVEGGDLVVNRGDESRPKDTNEKRELNPADDLEDAIKLAQANIEELIKHNKQPAPTTSSIENPTTYSYVYLRVQPFISEYELPTASESEEGPTLSQLQFVLYLSDPAHNLTHTTITQAIPGQWVDLWDEFEWVEDLVVEVLRVGVEVVGQEYIVSRMGWANKKQNASEPAAESSTSTST